MILAPIIAAGATFACTPIAVWDGDGPIWCAEGPKIRLAGIAAREIDGTCRSNQPCPAADAQSARNELVRMLGGARGTLPTGHVRVKGPRLTCLSDGSGRGDRTAAWCTAPAIGDLSCRMVQGGYALRWDRYWRGKRCP